MITNKDELNNLHSEQINKYFSEMMLPDEEIAKRIELCEELDYLFFVMWTLASAIDKAEGGISEEQAEYLKDYGYQGYMDVLSDKGYEDEKFYPEYVQDTINQLVDTTVSHINEPYYTSEKRSVLVAETETNSVGNYDLEQSHIKQGYTHKTWVTMKDDRVRHSHMLVDDITIGIYDMFNVGACQMLYPCDEKNGTAEEIVSCRCVCNYTKKDFRARRKKENEGVFVQKESRQFVNDIIKPRNIINEMKKSDIGNTLLKLLTDNNIPVFLEYEKPLDENGNINNDLCGEYFLGEITIYVANTKTVLETAISVIHEATHVYLKNSGLSEFDEEVECFKNEKIHLGIELTPDVVQDIIDNIKRNYNF